jgi:hypothetical protein
MKAIIRSSDSRKGFNRSVVYVESALDEVANQWFGKHKIRSLDFRCKTWEKACKVVNKQHIKALKELFPEADSIRFSRTAGCNCGCSPGFIMKYTGNVANKSFWVDMNTDETTKSLVEAAINKLDQALETEKLSQQTETA